MNHLAIDRGARQQIRSLLDHSSPTASPSLLEPPRTARALALLCVRWKDARSASEQSRRARLEELESFVGVTQGFDSELSARLEGSQ